MSTTLFTNLDVARSMRQLWEPLSEAQRQVLVDRLIVHSYKRNEEVFGRGSQAQSMYYLVKGKVTVYRIGRGERRQIVQMVPAGSLFGYVPAFRNELRKSTAIADEEAVTAELPIDMVLGLICQNNDFAMVFIQTMAGLLEQSVAHTMNITQKHIRGRLAENLLRMRQKYGLKRDNMTLTIYLSRDDLASMSNMTTSNAIRTISAFAEEGLIAIEERHIKYLDVEGLQRVSELG